MSKINIDEHKKNRVDKLDAMTTSVNIEERHHAFIKKHNINLSSIVRDVLDDLMVENESQYKRKK